MAKIVCDLCELLVNEPIALAAVMFGLLCFMGYVHTTGVRGRRRLHENKLNKDEFDRWTEGVDRAMARIEQRVYQLATKQPMPPLSKDVIDKANGE